MSASQSFIFGKSEFLLNLVGIKLKKKSILILSSVY